MTVKKKGGGGLFVLIAALLILAAVAGGYYFAEKYKNGPAPDDPSGATVQGTDDTGTQPTGVSYTALNMTPVDLLFVTNSETGRIEKILIEILGCIPGKLYLIGIDTDVSCTMSAKLYGELTPDNTELPQTVTFSELYRYYHNDKAYDAGRRIISELINFNILYYTAVEDTVFDEFMYYRGSGDAAEAGFRLGADELKGKAYGTEGSAKGAIEAAFKDAVTNWSVADRLRYLEAYDALTKADVTFEAAPVNVKNESTSLDTAGTGAILYRILY